MGNILMESSSKRKKQFIIDLTLARSKNTDVAHYIPSITHFKYEIDRKSVKRITSLRFKLSDELLKLRNRIKKD